MTTPTLQLTDERRAFVEAIRDFCRRECGTREQRDALTDGGEHAAQPGALRRRWPTWAGSASRSPRSTAAPAAASSTCACFSRRRRAGMAPIGGFGVTLDRRAAPTSASAPRSRSRRSSAAIVERRGRGDRDVRAGGRLRRRRAAAAGPSARNGGYVVNGQKTWISDAHLADHILLVCRTDDSRRPSTRASRCSTSPPDADGMEIRPIETMGGASRQRRLLHRLPRRRRARCSASEGQGWTQLMAGLNVERLILAALMLGTGAARLRRHARLRQGAQAVRPADRLLPGAQAPASPTSRPRSSAAAC